MHAAFRERHVDAPDGLVRNLLELACRKKAAQRFQIAVPEARNRSGVRQAAAGADDSSGEEKRARKALDRMGRDLASEIVSKKRCGQRRDAGASLLLLRNGLLPAFGL